MPDDPNFTLEPDVHPGTVPPRVIDELRHCFRIARDHTKAYGDALVAQAEKFKVKPGALRRYIAAVEGDKLEDVERENDDLARLIERGECDES